MGFLENMASKELGNISGGKGAMLMGIMKMIQSRPGGIQGLLKDFEQNGMGDAVKSWLGDGENKKVSSDQVKRALSNEDIQKVANEAGVSHEQAASGIGSLLPEVVDKLSENGKMPQDNDLVNKGLEFLKGRLAA